MPEFAAHGLPGAREIPAEPGKPTAIPHLEGKGGESSLEESRGNRVYTRRRVYEAFSLLLDVAKFRAEWLFNGKATRTVRSCRHLQ
jgi:hypothetical protein